MEWLSNIFKIEKLPTKIVFWLFLFSLVLLLIPEKAISVLQIQLAIQKYGMYIGLVCLGSGLLLFVNLLIFLWQKFKVSGIDAKQKIDKLVDEWNNIIDSSTDFNITTHTAEEPTDPNSFEVTIGAEGLYRQVQMHGFDQTCPVMMRFNRLKTRTIADIESIKNIAPLKKYLDQIGDVGLAGDFRSRSEVIQNAKSKMTFIRDLLLEIRNSI